MKLLRRKVLTGHRVVCEAPSCVVRFASTAERKAEYVEKWVCEVMELVQSHRDIPAPYLEVVREYAYVCPDCGYAGKEGDTRCAWCEKEVVDETP